MNITNLHNADITLLEIYLNGYKHFRNATAKAPKTKREQKAQLRNVRRFYNWLTTVLNAQQCQFLLPFGLIDVVAETRIKLQQIKLQETSKITSYELQML